MHKTQTNKTPSKVPTTINRHRPPFLLGKSFALILCSFFRLVFFLWVYWSGTCVNKSTSSRKPLKRFTP